MIAAFAVENHLGCLRECLQNSKCQSVNYYKPMTYQKSAYCELLSETQYDNPRAMRPYSNTVYFEKIHCRVDEYDLPTGKLACTARFVVPLPGNHRRAKFLLFAGWFLSGRRQTGEERRDRNFTIKIDNDDAQMLPGGLPISPHRPIARTRAPLFHLAFY